MSNNYLKTSGTPRYLLANLMVLLILLPAGLMAQAVLQSESFESATIFPAPGWRQQKAATNVNGAFVLQPVATATNPAPGASPGGGANLMMFNSFVANLGDTSLMISKPFDFSNNGGVDPFLRFFMYRDNGFLTADDRIRVYINTVPSLTGATLLANSLGSTDIFRRNTGTPAATANTWNQYTYNLPAATYNGKRYYFIFMGICRDGNNIYLDQVQVNTYPTPTLATDVKMNLFLQNGASVGVGTNNHVIVGVRCVIGGTSGCGVIDAAVPALTTAVKLDSILMNTNGTTNVLDIDDAKIYYTGGSSLFDTTYVSPFPVTAGSADYPSKRFGQTIAVPGTNLDFLNQAASCFYLEYDTTYFWLTYDVKSSALGGNFVDADLRGYAVGGSNTACPSPAGTSTSLEPDPGGFSLSGASQIDLPYCVGTYTVGTSWLNGSYTNNDFIQSVLLVGANSTAINTSVQGGMPASQPSNNNTGLPSNLPCLLSNSGSGCDFTAHPVNYELWPPVAGRTVVLTQGVGYSVTVQAGTWASNNNIAVWIDYNRDGDFLDVGENLGQVSLLANASQAIAFTVPGAGYTGVTRMRVREVFAAANIDPCLQYTYGEIEDFPIIIAPNCPAGYRLWLGNTDDWFNPGNWCGGIPAITDDAVLDRVQVFPPTGTPTRRYFPATIKTNAQANCNNLTISSQDSLVFNAPNPLPANALKVRRDITNNGRIRVISSLPTGTSVTYSNGTNNFVAITPFRATASDARLQIIYQASELTLAGLVGGDRISQINYTLQSKGSTAPYNNFTIGYALIPNGSQFATGVANATPLTTVFGPLAYSTAPGLNSISLTNPIIWDGTSNILVQYCFDNAGTVGSTNDVILSTQTTGINSVLMLSNTSGASSGCALVSNGVPAFTVDNFWSATRTYRPNFTFFVTRPYGKTLIRVQEDWINNGAFEPGFSRVVFDSTAANTIAGTQNTTFNELQVNKGAAAQSVTMLRPITVDTSVVLSQGLLVMNGNTLTMNNPAATGNPGANVITSITGPFERTNGFLISESITASVIWRNITTPGFRVIPFGHNVTSSVYIPFSFRLTSGTLGDVSVSTAYWPGNAPLPPGVSHINTTTGGNNAGNTVDRFWNVGQTGTNPVVDVAFRFSNQALPVTERPAGMSTINQGRAQPWWNFGSNRAWIRLGPPATTGTYTQSYGFNLGGTFDSVRVSGFNWPAIQPQAFSSLPPLFNSTGGPLGNTNIWTITNSTATLPVELLHFDAKPVGSRVRLNWSTASEVNNDYFTVERAADQTPDAFDFITKVNSQLSNSTVTLQYEAWDNNPLPGLQYYRLKQTDFDGQFTYSELRPVYFGPNNMFEISNVYGAAESDGVFRVEFVYDSELPLDLTITDARGAVLYTQSGIAAQPGVNSLQLFQQLPRGVYFVMLRNADKMVNRKFFY